MPLRICGVGKRCTYILFLRSRFSPVTSVIRISFAIATKQQTTLHCSLSPIMQYCTVNLILRGLFLPIPEFFVEVFFFSPPPCLEGWLFSPRALSFVSQPSYSTEDTGSTGLGSYCSKGK